MHLPFCPSSLEDATQPPFPSSIAEAALSKKVARLLIFDADCFKELFLSQLFALPDRPGISSPFRCELFPSPSPLLSRPRFYFIHAGLLPGVGALRVGERPRGLFFL